MKERYENGDVALEVRDHAGFLEFSIEAYGLSYILLKQVAWNQLRELLEAYWEETDDRPHADR